MIDIPEPVVATIRMRARSGITDGRDQHPAQRAYLQRCTHFHWQTGTLVMFTRDTGHHSSGWFKNPDFERCWHLSLSFREPYPGRPAYELASVARLGAFMRSMGLHMEPVAFDPKLAETWAKAVLGEDHRLSWKESPFSREGKMLGVTHWRVFCDAGWQPIKPRGEVYARELTAAGWQSWSDQHAEPNWVDAE